MADLDRSIVVGGGDKMPTADLDRTIDIGGGDDMLTVENNDNDNDDVIHICSQLIHSFSSKMKGFHISSLFVPICWFITCIYYVTG